MPEIAEVEMVRQGLELLRGEDLTELRSLSPKLSLPAPPIGEPVRELRRKGKLLGISFGEVTLEAHLRMTGRFLLAPVSEELTRDHIRAHARFESHQLAFYDPRGFAVMRLAPSAEFGSRLGPDLFDDWDEIRDPDHGLRPPQSRRAVKAVLLDQSVVAGIGNYLADESLWSAQINPTQPAESLTPGEWLGILSEARALAERTLKLGGVSIRDYQNAQGESGQGQELLRVYGRAGEACLRCGSELVKSVVAGRGTTICPECQPRRAAVS